MEINVGPSTRSAIPFLLSLFATLLAAFYLFLWLPLFALLFFTIVPLLLSRRWFTHPEAPQAFFVYLKLYSVLIACIWFAIVQMSELRFVSWAHLTGASLLIMNISEAVLVDLRKGKFFHLLSASFGLVLNGLLLTVFFKGEPATPMILGQLPLSWILAYSIWNWAFVFMHWPKVASKHGVVLGVSLLCAITTEGSWLISRAYLLTLFLIIQCSVPLNFSVQYLDDLPNWNKKKTLSISFSLASLALLWSFYSFWHF